MKKFMEKYGDESYYAACEQQLFKRTLAEVTNYVPFTDFYSELSKAEWNGKVTETCQKIFNEWSGNVRYMTEFVMALNYKSWEMNSRNDEELTTLYVQLYEEYDNKMFELFSGSDLDYYLDTTD